MWVAVIFFCFLLFGPSQADNGGQCEIDGISDLNWSVSFTPSTYDNEDNKEIFAGSYTGTLTDLSCTCSSNCNSKHEYFTFSSNDTYFGISTSEYMTQVDQDYSTTNEIVVGYKCTMTCKDISTLSVIITIQDYNSYDPAFENPDGYTYKVASPIMPKTDFSVYGDSIIVTDLDFSNTDIVFTIEPNDFTISTTVEGNKAYLANFKANQPIILSETTTYYLTATDSGTYPHTRNTTIPITLEVDESTSLEVPTFVFPNSSVTSYTFQYEDDGTLTALSGTITLSTNKADTIKNTDYGINGEYSESFSIEFVVDTKTFVLTNTQLIENPSTFITILTLSVTTDTKVSVPIVIKFSSVQSPVYFNRPSYTATYIEGTAASVKLDQDIQVISDTTPQVSLSSVDDGDDLSDRFTIALDDKSNSYLVTVKTPLTTDEIKSNLYLNLLITAKVDTESSTANLIISIPSHTLQFTEVLYTVTYTDDDTIDMGETSIAFTNGATNIIITVDDAYEKYLEVNDKYELEVKEKLPSDILLSQADITVTLTAKDDYDNQAQAVIKVALPLQDTLDAPKFTKPYYKISYSKDNQADYIDFEDPITFDNVNDMSTINIDLSNYGDNFKVEYDTDLNKWRIHVDKPLNSSIFDNNVELITTMQAKKESVYDEGLAVLVIQLDGGSIDVNVPAFKDAYYTAVYPKEGQGTISFENNVDFDNVENINDVTITITDYTDNFEVTYNSSEKAWQINIIKPLDDSVLSKNTFLTSTLSAKINGDSKHNPIAAFVLTLPEQEVSGSITFSKAYYEAQYVVEGSTATVTLEDNIEFDGNVNVNNIEITADEYSVYFSFSYDDTSKIWKVKTENILDLNTLSRTNLVVSITATDKTTDSTGVSVIDLKLPNINTGEAPKFSKPYYTATYQISDGKSTVTLDDPLEITTTDGNMDNIGVATDKYNENFDVKYTDGKWSIEVTIDLDQEILKNRVDLAMSLIASDKTNTADVGLSALVISLPKVNNDDAPLFSSTYYESQLNSSTTVLETTTSIQISNKPEADLSKITVAILENDYKSNFDVNFDETSSSWLITVVSLPEEAMKTSNGLVLTLTAIETGNESNIGLSALVLSFPVQTTTPTFSSSQYFGNYTDETLQIDDVIITNIDDQSDITVKLDGDFSDNLEINYDEASKTWKIKLSKPFNDDDIRGKSELIMTLSATETGNDNIGYATVIIYLLSNSDNGDLSFSAVYYEGQYKITGGDDTLTLSNDIKLVSDKDLSSAVVVFEISDEFDPTKYFDIASTDTTGTYTITVKQNLPSDILTEQSLVTTLKATLENSQSYATLVIKLPAGDSSIEFSKVLYNGEYKWIDSTTDFTVEDITFTVPASDTSDIKVSISTDPQYSEYFSVTTKDNKVTLKAAEIPTDVLETVSVIPITLTATSSGTSKPGSTVVNININYDKGSLAFSAALYNGKYSIQKGEATIEVDTITLNTDRTNDDLILVTVDNSYKDYFSATYKAQTVTLVKEQDIPSTIIADIQTISIQLSASISNTNVQSQSVVNLRIINGDDPIPDVTGTLQFDNIVNTGQYSVVNGDGVYEADAKIGLTTDRTNEEVEVNIKEDSEFKDYFKISYENQIVNVSLVQNLPDDVFLSNKYISLTLVASTTDKTLSSSAVLNIRMNNDDVIDNGYISFVSTVYNGKYEIKDAEAEISYDEIKVVTDQEDQNIVMSLEGSYAQYFEVTYTDKTINLTLIDTDANENLRTLTNLAVVVKAQIKDTNHVASAVVNFQVIDYDNGGNNDGSISIPSLVYTSEYDLDIATFETCEIPVQTQHLEQELTVKMSNEYKYEEYFNVAYSQNNITISLNKTLPASKIEKLGVIAMSIKIYLTDNKDIFGEAVLNIRIHKKSKSTDLNYTGYIVAISIMGALLFLLIAGTVAFYFFKFKKGRYKQMTEEEYINSKVKFDKTSLKRQSGKSKRSSALDERRPTGFVFHPTSNELDKEPSDSSTDEMKERKKSVAFDENVEKMQIDTINDDDIDKALDQNEKGDAAIRF